MILIHAILYLVLLGLNSETFASRICVALFLLIRLFWAPSTGVECKHPEETSESSALRCC